jgi:hypothetical protein
MVMGNRYDAATIKLIFGFTISTLTRRNTPAAVAARNAAAAAASSVSSEASPCK